MNTNESIPRRQFIKQVSQTAIAASFLSGPLAALGRKVGSNPVDYGKPAPKWLREAGMFNGWWTTTDHTGDTGGYMLIVNGSYDPVFFIAVP